MNPASAGDAIVQEVLIKAPAERVFEALTNPAQRVQWWGAEARFQATQMESDLRPGGAWMMSGNGVGGRPFTVRGKYLQIDRPRLLIFTWLPSWQENAYETIVRFDLAEADGCTTVRLTHSGFTTEDSRLSHKGWPEILTWLRAYSESRV